MATHSTTHEIPVSAEANEQPIDVRQDVERQPVEYDPSRVRTLTTKDMQAIEDDIWAAHDKGLGPSDLQDLINAHLERVGIESSDIKGGVLVARVEGVDGKSIVRAIVADYGDFGTNVRHVDLIPTESEAEASEEDEEANAEEKRAQDHMLETIVEDMNSNIRRVSQELEAGSESQRLVDAVIEDTTGHIQVMAKRLMNGEPIERYELLRLTQDEVPNLISVLNREVSTRDDERQAVNRLVGDVEDASGQNPNLDDDHRDTLRDIVRRVGGAVDDLQSNRNRLMGVSEQVMQTFGQIGRVLEEMSYSQHGGESYGSQLYQLLRMFDEQVGDNRMLRRQSSELLDTVKRQLSA